MRNYSLNIYDFFKNPWDAVLNGYDPCYLTCVSMILNNSRYLILNTIFEIKSLKDLLNMEVGDFLVTLSKIMLQSITIILLPFLCWIFSAYLYFNIRVYIKKQS